MHLHDLIAARRPPSSCYAVIFASHVSEDDAAGDTAIAARTAAFKPDNAGHASARAHGCTQRYDHFKLRIAKVERAYGTPSNP